MEIGGFEFRVSELDGCRVIESVYPESIDITKLAQTIASYYDLWDDETPTISLGNLCNLGELSDEAQQILKSVIQRTVLEPSFVAAAWFTGENDRVYDEITRVRREAGRTTNDVYRTREEAIEFLRAAIRDWRAERSREP
jgi:hypothetical protein